MFETGQEPPSFEGSWCDFADSATPAPCPTPARLKLPDNRPLQPTLPPRLNCESVFSSKGYTVGARTVLRSPNWCKRLDIPAEDQSITMSPSAEMSALAFASLQLLPVPMMVLSENKVVVFANEAMATLLDLVPEETPCPKPDGWRPQSTTDILRGKSLFEVGVKIRDERSPEWESWRWNTLLEDVVKEMRGVSEGKTESHYESNHGIGYGNQVPHPIPWRMALDPRCATTDVVFRPQRPHNTVGHEIPGETRVQNSSQMSVTAWQLNSETYFTLTFTSIMHTVVPVKGIHSPEPSRSASPMETGSAGSATETPATPTCRGHHKRGEALDPNLRHGCCSSTWTPPAEIVPFRSHLQQKVAELGDSLIDLMEFPVFIMRADGSLAFPNKAAVELLKSTSKTCVPVGHALDIINCFRVYKEDFSRALTLEEHPIVRTCKMRENFNSVKMGLIDVLGNKKVFDVGGKGIVDEETGEFLAGMCWARDVTEFQEKLDAQKAEDELRFMTFCDVMPQLVWTTTPTGYVDWWSEKWYDFTGLTLQESTGLAWGQSIHPNELNETLEKWDYSLKTGEGYVMEYRIKRWDGQYRWMLARGLPLRDPNKNKILKWFGTCTDIDELVQARLDAKRTREQLTNVMAHAALTLWTIDKDLKVSMIEGDQIWAKNVGTPQSSFIGKSIYDIVSKEENPEFYTPLEGILNGTITEEKNTEYNMNGRCLRTTYVPIKGQEDSFGKFNEDLVTGVIGICVDITDRVNTLQELADRERENQILMANERAAKDASKLKSDFLASMSHEIRTPIAGVLGMADLLIDTDLTPEQLGFVTSIQSSANALLAVINDILDISKVESGKMEIEHVEFNLCHVVMDVIRMLAFEAEKKKLAFEHDIKLKCRGKEAADIQQCKDCCFNSAGDLCCVMGDPGRLRQVLTNLTANSIKFTQKGSVRLSLSMDDEGSDALTAKFVVADTGIGIAEEKQPGLFHPFTQADSSTARRFGGTGLGLSISKNLVELMGGNIGLSSKVGVGTTAWFSIPFNKPGHTTSSRSASISSDISSEGLNVCPRSFERLQQRPPPMRGSSTSRTYPPSQGECRFHIPGTLPDSKLHQLVNALDAPLPPPVPTISLEVRKHINILVVEDNDINQQIALRMIEKLGFSVSAVPNGVEALRYLHSCTEGKARRPDIVLMDVHMPEMDGYQATQVIRTGDLAAAGLGLDGDIDERDRQWLMGLPIVALTANAIRGDSDKCLEAGMDDYLAKPVNRHELEMMLLKWLVDHHMRHGSVVEPFGNVCELMAGMSNGNNVSRGGCWSTRCTCGDGKQRSRANGIRRRQRPVKPRCSITTLANTPAVIDWASCCKYGNGLPDDGDHCGQVPGSNVRVGEEEKVVQEEEEIVSDNQPMPKAFQIRFSVPVVSSTILTANTNER